MNINEAYPSKYLKAADLPDEGSEVATIESVAVNEIGRDKESKIVVSFTELDKALICNKTNARTIARALGSEECDDWVGRRIALYRTEVEFGGDMYDAIRVKSVKAQAGFTKPKPVGAAAAHKKAAPPPDGPPDDDEIPF
jgi:hypothetical protein